MANRPIRRAWCEEGRPRKHQECPTPHLKGKLSAAEGGPFQGGVHQKSSDFRMFLKWVKHPNTAEIAGSVFSPSRKSHNISQPRYLALVQPGGGIHAIPPKETLF